MSILWKNLTADVQHAVTKCDLLGPGQQVILHGNPSAIAATFSPHMAVLRCVVFTEYALPVLHVASGHPRWRLWHLCSQRWILFVSVWGSGSARKPDCLPSCEVAQEVLLIPLSGRESFVEARNKTKRKCQVRREVSCETCCEMGWLLNAHRDNTTPVNILILEPHAMRLWRLKCAQTCATRREWEKCACDGVFCLHLSPSLTKTPWKICEFTSYDLSIGDLSLMISPLVISPLGVLVFAPLRVLVFAPLRVLLFVLRPILWR